MNNINLFLIIFYSLHPCTFQAEPIDTSHNQNRNLNKASDMSFPHTIKYINMYRDSLICNECLQFREYLTVRNNSSIVNTYDFSTMDLWKMSDENN